MATIIDPPNSVWPNGLKVDSEGYVTFYTLGTNKVDINTITWPKGDKLVSPFVYEDDKLAGFIDTEALTIDSQTIIYLPYEHIEAEFLAIDKGQLQIHAPKATIKKASWADSGKEDIPEAQFKYKGCKTVDDMTAVDADFKTNDVIDGVWSEPLWDLENGNSALKQCYTLTTFSSDLPNLTNGRSMFSWSNNLVSFSSDLPNLTNGYEMFFNCNNLAAFSFDLSSLTNGESMFYNTNLTSFSSDLSSLTEAYNMFSGCTNLTSFTSDLPNLTNGLWMFGNCENLASFNVDLSSVTDAGCMFYRTNLTSFFSNLSNLTNGYNMFDGCKLDASSVKNIIETINTYSGELTLGMGCNDTAEDKDLFAQEVGYADMTSLLAALQVKGWTVGAQYNGRPTTTYGLRRTVEDTLPVYVKLEEIEDHAAYTSLDDSKKFRLNWFHETTGSTEGYTQYATLEESIETLDIKPIENINNF